MRKEKKTLKIKKDTCQTRRARLRLHKPWKKSNWSAARGVKLLLDSQSPGENRPEIEVGGGLNHAVSRTLMRGLVAVLQKEEWLRSRPEGGGINAIHERDQPDGRRNVPGASAVNSERTLHYRIGKTVAQSQTRGLRRA